MLARFDVRQLLTGRADQWVAGGALAIAALASAKLALAARAIGGALDIVDGPRVAAPLLGVVGVAWLPILVAGEVSRPRISYDARRWATVFPVAMYAAAGFDVGRLAGVEAVMTLARGWAWVAFVVWAVVMAGMLAHGGRLLAKR